MREEKYTKTEPEEHFDEYEDDLDREIEEEEEARKRAKREKRRAENETALADDVRFSLKWGVLLIICALVIIGLLVAALLYLTGGLASFGIGEKYTRTETEAATETETDTEPVSTMSGEEFDAYVMEQIETADRLAAMYDYDAAADCLREIPDYETYEAIEERIAEYEETKESLVVWDNNAEITHIFFHSLIYDEGLAWSSSKASDYNQNMATVDEFLQIIETMYEEGYVLVSLHDVASLEGDEDGYVRMNYQTISLPPGKIPFVLSQDDVCYYEYMEGHGFASRLVLEDGKVTTEMDLADGTVKRGSYDLIPLLDDFIEEHPDFSYRGAKGIIGVTGYEGIFGYRTSAYNFGEESTSTYYEPNANIEADRQTASQIAAALKADGWEIASHSWGHPKLGQCSDERFYWDTDMWESEVEPLVGETDILLYPNGDDVGSWRPYSEGQAGYERVAYLENAGFHYFCTVDSAQYWVQKGSDWLRQGRRNIDGTRMYQAIVAEDYLSDLFDAASVFSSLRPTPVGSIVPKETENAEETDISSETENTSAADE